jgi:hypothetical protein
MAVTTSGSTVPRRQLGRYLRGSRENARLTVRAAARALEWSEAKMWRIESGMVPLRSHDVETMCRTYGVSPDLTEALMALARETKARGWWHAYGDVIPGWFNVFVGLEEAATQLHTYEPELVPGLLQTADYARAIIRALSPDLDPIEVERRVEFRLARQVLLTRTAAPLAMAVVLNEAVVRRPLADRTVMTGQCRRLAELSELPNVDLRILPFTVGFHPGVRTGPFVILRFPANGDGRETEPPTVYVENVTGALYLDQPHEITRYDVAFDRLLAAADDDHGDRSREILRRAAREAIA